MLGFSPPEPERRHNDKNEPFTRQFVSDGVRAVLPPVPAQVLKAGATRAKVVALTFDACWKTTPAAYDSRVIGVLRQTKTPATLFLGGVWMEKFPQVTRELAADPLFEIGNHSYLHPHLTRMPREVIAAELVRTHSVYRRLTGRTMAPLFRPPYGEYNDTVVRVAAENGFKTVVWSIESGDPDKKQTASEILKDCLRQLRPGGIVVMHINGRGWHTAEALPRLIAEFHKRGYHFMKVSALANS